LLILLHDNSLFDKAEPIEMKGKIFHI